MKTYEQLLTQAVSDNVVVVVMVAPDGQVYERTLDACLIEQMPGRAGLDLMVGYAAARSRTLVPV